MAFNISSFKSNLDTYSYLKNNKYEVFLAPPPLLLNQVIGTVDRTRTATNISNLIKFRAEEVIAPGFSVISADVNRYGIGPTQKVPFSAQFGEIKIVFLADRDSFLLKFWHLWLRTVFEANARQSLLNTTSGNRFYEVFPTYTAEYRENFSSTAQIIIYDDTGKSRPNFNLYEVFPIAMSDTPLSWNETELLRITVTLSFKEFTISDLTTESRPITEIGTPYTP